ncbi:hypothetical protein VNO78_09119 [Psophocarpus tetragonolobus]|uniref:Uncharacterized protein n=1 Tax=Psophocarpus tetragonolobus TaxID=3891 RepID=A0AAN9T6C1_PSOTE
MIAVQSDKARLGSTYASNCSVEWFWMAGSPTFAKERKGTETRSAEANEMIEKRAKEKKSQTPSSSKRFVFHSSLRIGTVSSAPLLRSPSANLR